MMRRAFEGTAFESLSEHLHGTNAIAISEIAGVVEGNYNDQAGIQALSTIPSREELLGKLLGSIQSPITNFARVLNQIAEQNGGADAAAAE